MVWFLGVVCLVVGCAAIAFARRTAHLRAALQDCEATRRALQGREAAEAALRLEHEALLERCGAGICFLDEAGVVQRANDTARQILGLPAQALVGRSLLQASLSDDLNTLFKQVRTEGRPLQQEMVAPGSSGGFLNATIAPLANNGAASARFLLVAHDITALRRLETVRRDFVANVSHELRTPLASIRAMAETLQDGALQDPAVAPRFLSTIIAEAQRLTRISDDLLILSDVEGRAPERMPFSLSGLIEQVVHRFQPQADQARLILRADVPPDLKVEANPDQMEQVIVNLIDNAIKYTPEDGQVCVTAERSAQSIAVHVADTGIGIMSQDQPRIFERFYRVDKARSRQSGGTGLGLSIVKHIVEAHGGQVTVESEYRHGSTFTFTLPLATEDADNEESTRPPLQE